MSQHSHTNQIQDMLAWINVHIARIEHLIQELHDETDIRELNANQKLTYTIKFLDQQARLLHMRQTFLSAQDTARAQEALDALTGEWLQNLDEDEEAEMSRVFTRGHDNGV